MTAGTLPQQQSSVGNKNGGSTIIVDQELSSTWQRSLSELAASNIKRSSSSMASLIGPPSAAAQALLGQRSTDLSGLLSYASKTRSVPQQQEQPGATSNAFTLSSDYGIEKSLENYCDGILNRILTKQQDQTERMLEEIVEKRREDDWTVEREWWKKELVRNRNLVDPSNKTDSKGAFLVMGNGSIGVENRDLLMSDIEKVTGAVSVS
jgi:hypothetical protein